MNTSSKNLKFSNPSRLMIAGIILLALATLLAGCAKATPTSAPTSPPPPAATGPCQLVSQDPPDNSTLAANTTYNFTWEIKNTGTEKWDKSEYDVIFVSSTTGTSMNGGSTYFDLPSTVSPGETVKISGKGTTPSATGSYSETWAIAKGKNPICPFDVVIKVQ
jgi:hypothetical protein